jgi:hypothetical protein
VHAARRLWPLLLAVALTLPALTLADTTSRKDRGKLRHTKGLSNKQRNALDITRVTATASTGGLVVTVRMKGNLDRALGRGKLRRARIALILDPRSRRRRPAVLVATGRRSRPRTLRRTRTDEVSAVRRGRTVTFAIAGSPRAVRRIRVRTFRGRPRPRRRARSSNGSELDREEVEALRRSGFVDEARAPRPATDAECESYEEQRGDLFDLANDVRQDGSLPERERMSAVEGINGVLDELDVEYADRCFGLRTSGGYEHQGQTTLVCADLSVLVERADQIASDFSQVVYEHPTDPSQNESRDLGGFGFGPDGKARLAVRVGKFGRYTFTISLTRKGARLNFIRRITVDVVAPPPNQTKDCG